VLECGVPLRPVVPLGSRVFGSAAGVPGVMGSGCGLFGSEDGL
jgi:hypothetical protein